MLCFYVLIFLSLQMTRCLSFRLFMHSALLLWFLLLYLYLHMLVCLDAGSNNIVLNKSVKIIGGGSYYDRATPFYTKLGIWKLADLA